MSYRVEVKPGDKIHSITLCVKEWLDKINGNTYYCCRILINGSPVHFMPFQYGHGSQVEYEAFDELERLGFLKREITNPGCKLKEVPWRYCEINKIVLFRDVSNVSRKRDLIA